MTDLEKQRARDRQLRNWALVWVIGSLSVAVLVAVVLLGSGRKEGAHPGAQSQAESPTLPAAAVPAVTAALPLPMVVTPSPHGGEASGVEQPAAQPAESQPVLVDAYGYGIQVHGAVGDPVVAVGQVERLGLGWIKQQVRWGDLELSPGDLNWGMIDGIIRAAYERQVRVMLSVVTAPAWSRPESGNTHGPPDDLNQFTAFLTKLLDRYPGQISAIEVWNEQNLDREWQAPDGLDAGRYVEMLRLAFQTIKAEDPNLVVISGALAPTGGWVEPDGRVTAIDDFSFFQQLLDAGMLNYTDCVGAHHNGYNIGPDVLAEAAPQDPQAATAGFRGPFDNVHHSWSFKSTLTGYSTMLAGQKKLCVTEFGWASSEGVGGTPAGFGFADDNTLAEQAEWIVQAYQLQREWGTTWLTFLWNLDYGPKGLSPEDDNVPYSILTYPDGRPRPAFEAVEVMPKP